MKIIDESIMTVDRVEDYCISDILQNEQFREFINELYDIQDNNAKESGINPIAVATDLSFALNTYNRNRSAIARPIRGSVKIIKYQLKEDLQKDIVAELNGEDAIIIEMNNDLYDLTNLKLYDIDSCYLEESEQNIYCAITPSQTYNEIVNYLNDLNIDSVN